MKVRPYSSSPAERLGLAAVASSWSSDFWSAEDVAAALAVPGTTLLFAGADAVWQGCILGRDDGADAELFYIYVEPNMRGRGVGRALFEAWRHGLQADSIHLEVRPSRHEALALYQALGFQVVRRRKNYYGDGEDALIMKRENL